jgi:hypothetical protein
MSSFLIPVLQSRRVPCCPKTVGAVHPVENGVFPFLVEKVDDHSKGLLLYPPFELSFIWARKAFYFFTSRLFLTAVRTMYVSLRSFSFHLKDELTCELLALQAYRNKPFTTSCLADLLLPKQ